MMNDPGEELPPSPREGIKHEPDEKHKCELKENTQK